MENFIKSEDKEDKMDDIRAITFDGDGTLWDFTASMNRALMDAAELLNSEGLRYKGQPVSSDFLKDVREEVAAWPIHATASMETIRFASFTEAILRCGIQSSDLVQSVYDRYMRVRLTSLDLFPDARPALQRLYGQYKLAIVTNGNTHPSYVGLEPLLDDIVVAAAVGYRKPDPAIYHLTLQRLGVSSAQALHVGDHPLEDVKAAQSAGMRAIWLNRRTGSQPTVCETDAVMGVISSLDELPDLLGVN